MPCTAAPWWRWMRHRALPSTVLRMWPMWNGLAMLGELKSMQTTSPLPAALPYGASSRAIAVSTARASALRRNLKLTNGPAALAASITSSGVILAAISAASAGGALPASFASWNAPSATSPCSRFFGGSRRSSGSAAVRSMPSSVVAASRRVRRWLCRSVTGSVPLRRANRIAAVRGEASRFVLPSSAPCVTARQSWRRARSPSRSERSSASTSR